jgi:hypothetical protein
VLAAAGHLHDEFKRAVRDLWGIDVWCPRCAGVGKPILRGPLADDPDITVNEDGTLRPWPAGNVEIGVCDITGSDPGYTCSRCRTQWGGRAGTLDRRGIASTLTDVLRQMNCVDLRDLAALIDSSTDLDTSVGLAAFGFDRGLNLGIGTASAELTFPMRSDDLWQAIVDLEQQVLESWVEEESGDS